jgi:uncharacterized protein (DUF2147 family)
MSTTIRFKPVSAVVFGLAVAVAAYVAPAMAVQAFDPYGIWVREESGTTFDFYNCDNKLCAKVVGVSKPEEKAGIGQVILRNAAKTKDNHWEGDIFNTRDGKTYSGKVILENPNELTLEGCLLGFLCKGETWTRSPDQAGASTPGGKPVAPAFKVTPTAAH